MVLGSRIGGAALGLLAGGLDLLGAGENLGGGGAEGTGDLEDVREAGVALAALDAADVGAVKPALLGKSCLGDPVPLADFADGIIDGCVGGGSGSHWAQSSVVAD